MPSLGAWSMTARSWANASVRVEYDARCTDATLARISFLLMTRVVPLFRAPRQRTLI
jgi:hypothetical protein